MRKYLLRGLERPAAPPIEHAETIEESRASIAMATEMASQLAYERAHALDRAAKGKLSEKKAAEVCRKFDAAYNYMVECRTKHAIVWGEDCF